MVPWMTILEADSFKASLSNSIRRPVSRDIHDKNSSRSSPSMRMDGEMSMAFGRTLYQMMRRRSVSNSRIDAPSLVN